MRQIADWGFKYADVTDNSDGACRGVKFGFTALASLDGNPFDLKRLFAASGLEISAWCAHANLLDPSAPWRYGSAQILKSIKAAAALGVGHVITTEGEPSTTFGHQLTDAQAIFITREKLHEPLRLAADVGVKLLLEPHGKLTGSLDHMERLLNECDSPALGLNLDTGNLWLGGESPVEFIRRFGKKIEHVHWKDMPPEMVEKRWQLFGCGMATTPLGSGVIGIADIFRELKKVNFDGHTTLEVAGESAVLVSRDYLLQLDQSNGERPERDPRLLITNGF